MDGLIEFIYLLGIVAVAFVIYTIYCFFVRFRFSRKWRNLDNYCKKEGYSCVARYRHQTDYRKELSRKKLQEKLQFFDVDCELPHDLRFFDNISVTYTKPYLQHTGFSEEYRGGSRVHRYMTIQWLENGRWMQYSGIMTFMKKVPYVNADFGGMSQGNTIEPENTIEEIGRKFEYELKWVLFKFKSTEIDRWNSQQKKEK